MVITVTLVCKCCNIGMRPLYAFKTYAEKMGHIVHLQSRNLHGREPKSLGLNINRTLEQIISTPTVIVEYEKTRIICDAASVSKFAQIGE